MPILVPETDPVFVRRTLPPKDDPFSTHPSSELILIQARHQAKSKGISYAGGLRPIDAWVLFQRGDAVIVDVRTAEERKFVGQVPGTEHVAWQTGANLVKNPRFLKELEKTTSKDSTILFLCRSGKRSAAAAEAAVKAGFDSVFNILEGFEGDLDENGQRGDAGGWRRAGLPWIQD